MTQLAATLPPGILTGRIRRDLPGSDARPKPGTARRRWRQALFAGVGLLAMAAGGELARQYWTVGRFQVSTDDA